MQTRSLGETAKTGGIAASAVSPRSAADRGAEAGEEPQSSPRLLLLDDDELEDSRLGALLARDGMCVTVEHDRNRAAQYLAQSEVDLLIAEIDVASDESLDFIRAARSSSELPIFVISECQAEDRIVRTLECGADDYVRAPFSASELLARVRNALRRPKPGPPYLERLPAGLALTSYERKLFETLASRFGEIVPNDVITRLIWGKEVRTPQNLRYLVFTLRRKLVGSGAPFQILNAWRGYKLLQKGGLIAPPDPTPPAGNKR